MFWTCQVWMPEEHQVEIFINRQTEKRSTHIQLIFNKNVKEIQWKKRVILLTNNARITEYPYTKKINLDPYFTPCIKINSKCTIGLNVQSKTLCLLEVNTDKNPNVLELGKDFLNSTPKTSQTIREKLLS